MASAVEGWFAEEPRRMEPIFSIPSFPGSSSPSSSPSSPSSRARLSMSQRLLRARPGPLLRRGERLVDRASVSQQDSPQEVARSSSGTTVRRLSLRRGGRGREARDFSMGRIHRTPDWSPYSLFNDEGEEEVPQTHSSLLSPPWRHSESDSDDAGDEEEELNSGRPIGRLSSHFGLLEPAGSFRWTAADTDIEMELREEFERNRVSDDGVWHRRITLEEHIQRMDSLICDPNGSTLSESAL